MPSTYKPSVVISAAPSSCELPASMIAWVSTPEAKSGMREALQSTLRKLAEMDKSRMVSRESLDKPLSTI